MSKIIISDTSCLIALSKIGRLDLLKDLFQEITITREVWDEYGDNLPGWIKVSEVRNLAKQAEIERKLDKGEASSIALALESDNPILIIDEVKGRRVAMSYQINIIGTIGIIALAGKLGLINDVIEILHQLISNEFRVSDELMNKFFEQYGTKQ